MSFHVPRQWLVWFLGIVVAPAGGWVAESVSAGGSGRTAADPCPGQQQIVQRGGYVSCTHGSDPELPEPPLPARLELARGLRQPAGNIITEPPEAFATPVPAPVTRGVHCYGDGTDGNRAELIYARPSDHPDRFAQVLPSIRRWAAEVETVFSESAGRFGAVRHVRFVTDKDCDLVVQNLVMASTADDTFENTVAELRARGFDRPTRKYLVWMDSDIICGLGENYLDDTSSQSNANNGRRVPGQVSRTDAPCWGRGASGHSTEAHEFLHTLGGVQASAPNASLNGHCLDESDLMCYADAKILQTRDVCDVNHEAVLDCGDDDYFNPSPEPGTYLASHWNTAHSSFLAHDEGIPAIDTVGTSFIEGDEGTNPARVVVSLSAAAPEGVSVRYTTASDSAQEGADFVATQGIVSFPPGQTTVTVELPITGDVADEPDESLVLRLFNPSGGVLRTAEAKVVILDDDPKARGFWLYGADGGVFAFGDAPFKGSLVDTSIDQQIVGLAPAGDGSGYWLAGDKGRVYPVGVPDLGSLAEPDDVSAMTASPSGAGYALLGIGGRVHPFGDAADLGLTTGTRTAGQVATVGLAATPTNRGYWLAGQDGRVYAFGDAPDLGSLSTPVGAGIFGFAATPTGRGYWLLDGDGTVTAFGDAPNLGSTQTRGGTVVGIASSPTGRGYWTTDVGGYVQAFGDAPPLGSLGGKRLRAPILGIVSRR
ncbi:MAG: Calx-beta domain-containing protein [Acidimicrobiia bacterium]